MNAIIETGGKQYSLSKNPNSIYKMMENMGFEGIEIAPTRIFPENPYDRLEAAGKWAKEIKRKHRFVVSSMQSIWYGKNNKLFGNEKERKVLVDYTKKAIDFADAIKCKNLVFGCPRNRNISKGEDEAIAIEFFRIIGKYAAEHNTVVGMEANPPIYNTNYINDTKSALDLIEKVGTDGFKLNLDVGAMIANEEDVSVLNGREHLINHVHISEPGLKPIEHRSIHIALFEMLNINGYDGFISIEVRKQECLENLEKMMKYVGEMFGETKR